MESALLITCDVTVLTAARKITTEIIFLNDVLLICHLKFKKRRCKLKQVNTIR
jgi:hypothetical protein